MIEEYLYNNFSQTDCIETVNFIFNLYIHMCIRVQNISHGILYIEIQFFISIDDCLTK